MLAGGVPQSPGPSPATSSALGRSRGFAEKVLAWRQRLKAVLRVLAARLSFWDRRSPLWPEDKGETQSRRTSIKVEVVKTRIFEAPPLILGSRPLIPFGINTSWLLRNNNDGSGAGEFS